MIAFVGSYKYSAMAGPSHGPRRAPLSSDAEKSSGWSAVLSRLDLEGGEIRTSTRILDPGRIVYLTSDKVHKITREDISITSHLRTNDLWKEYEILRACAGIHGVPVPVRVASVGGVVVLSLERIDADPLDQTRMTPWFRLRIAGKLVPLVLRLARVGISHNDIQLDNILIAKDGSIFLVDFDQATVLSRAEAIRTLLGCPPRGTVVYGSVRRMAKEALVDICRSFLKRVIPRSIVKRVRAYRRARANRLPTVAPGSREGLVRSAWQIAQRSNASSPNVAIAYYSMEFGGHAFPGERPWALRWEVLRHVTPLQEKRVLELGCNMGLLSTHALREEGASAALGIDIDAEIIEAAKLVARAYGVSPSFARVDLDSPEPWEATLDGFRPDVVFALNVLNWVNDKQRLLTFLGRFETVVFEGHDDFETEKARFKAVGFTNIDLISHTERQRPLIRCRK